MRQRGQALRSPDEQLRAIERTVRDQPDGASVQDIARKLPGIAHRTLQRRLKQLVDQERLVMAGERRWARYDVRYAMDLPPALASRWGFAEEGDAVPLSAEAATIQKYVRQPVSMRTPSGYDRAFLDSYRPNVTSYLSPTERQHLRQIGSPRIGEQPAGTFAKQILQRLLIDLSWNSSRLEGNTYSLLNTQRLIELGEEAEGHGGSKRR